MENYFVLENGEIKHPDERNEETSEEGNNPEGLGNSFFRPLSRDADVTNENDPEVEIEVEVDEVENANPEPTPYKRYKRNR